ncbi:MAG: pirin family protein [Sphingobium sp.]|nr:pirin family protein [Sphingobium sp.]
MTTLHASTPLGTPVVPAAIRKIVHRTGGRQHGPVTRLVSPGDLGGLIKPFVFLDWARFEADAFEKAGFGWHPHSGIATLTLILDGAIHYADSTGAKGVLESGAVEWFEAAGGAWHSGGGVEAGAVYQLWVALPPGLENGPATSRYLSPENFPRRGPVRVILGQWEGITSPIPAPSPMTYLDVILKAGEVWRFDPPAGQDVAWIAVHSGAVNVPETVASGELVVFEHGDGAIVFQADQDARFILGAAAKHPHDLVLGHYSVHTSQQALQDGESNYRQVGKGLKLRGII